MSIPKDWHMPMKWDDATLISDAEWRPIPGTNREGFRGRVMAPELHPLHRLRWECPHAHRSRSAALRCAERVRKAVVKDRLERLADDVQRLSQGL